MKKRSSEYSATPVDTAHATPDKPSTSHFTDEYTWECGPHQLPAEDFHEMIENIATTKKAIKRLQELRREKSTRNHR